MSTNSQRECILVNNYNRNKHGPCIWLIQKISSCLGGKVSTVLICCRALLFNTQSRDGVKEEEREGESGGSVSDRGKES